MTTGKTTLVAQSGDKAGFVTLTETIGVPGEQGEVWLAHSTNEPKLLFAVKISHFRTDDVAFAAFRQEIEALVSFSHPNIVRVYATGNSILRGDQKVPHPFYVMEYLGNVRPLRKLFEVTSPERRTLLCLQAFKDSASALAHVHDKGRAHRDVKSSNILIRPFKNSFGVVLIDFGFSRLLGERNELEGDSPHQLSSVARSRPAATDQHMDIFQLSRQVKDLLNSCPDPTTVPEPERALWPIDYAAFEHLKKLIEDWASNEPQSKPESAETADFYDELSKLTKSYDLAPDVKGASRYLSIPEIATAAKVRPAFEAMKLPPQRLVLYTDRIKQLITLKEFGRLRYIRQLGFTHLVYPGAQGTRFEHSLGVYDLACQFAMRLAGHSAFRKVCPNEPDVLKFILAALIHDIGHFPMAHQLEEFSRGDFLDPDHKKVSDIIKGHIANGRTVVDRINPDLKQLFNFADADIDDIKWIAFAKNDDPQKSPAHRLLRTLLNGPIDIDKLDYVERDAHHCGVPYGSFLDVERIKETMRVEDESGTSVVAFDRRGLGSLELLANARHQLYANVYWHRAVRSATAMFKQAFYLFQQLVDDKAELEGLFFEASSDDCLLHEMLARLDNIGIQRQHVGGFESTRRAIERLLSAVSGRRRALYKMVHERQRDSVESARLFGGQCHHAQREIAARIFEVLLVHGILLPEAKEIGANNVIIDCTTDTFPDFDAIKIKVGAALKHLGAEAPSVRFLKENYHAQACKIRVFVNEDVIHSDFKEKGRRAIIGQFVRKAIYEEDE